MPSFIASSVCNGERPRHLAHASYFFRNALLARMMQDRGKVRYLVAPAFFGKSYLACSYAQMAFEFNDTSWINAQSPCFLRDLDSGELEQGLLELVSTGGLVVIDDVPQLTRQRTEALWKLCQGLLAAGREVVVCCTPGADPLARRADRCVRIGAQELLFTDDDLDGLRRHDPSARRLRQPTCPAERVPGLLGGDEHAGEQFLAAAFRDQPAGRAAVLFAMLALASGSFDDVERVVGRAAAGKGPLEGEFPYLAVDEQRAEFSAEGFSARALHRSASPCLLECARACGLATASDLVERAADVLCGNGRHQRALGLLDALAAPPARAAWLAAHQGELADAGVLAACESLFEGLRHRRESRTCALVVGSAFRRALLGEREGALDLLVRVAQEEQAPGSQRLLAATYVLLLAKDPARVVGALEPGRGAREKGRPARGDEGAELLGAFWRHVRDGDGGLSAVLARVADDPGPGAAWALACALRACGRRAVERCDEVARAAALAAAWERRGGSMGLACVFLRRALEEALGDEPATLPVVALLREGCEDLDRALRGERAVWCRQHEAEPSADVSPAQGAWAFPAFSRPSSIPLLTIRMFGCFEVAIGGEPVDDALLGRQKTCALLAVLALNAGRDLSCERLAETFWPDSTIEKAKHNFYSTVSWARRAVTLPSGECPYLVGMRGVVRMHADLVESDAQALRELCRALQFERHDPQGMAQLLESMRGIYAGELLPGNAADLPVLQARTEFRERTVDSALHAADLLEAEGDLRCALRFARQALEWDPHREDCYASLMLLQARCGQRPAAAMTWQQYNRVMREAGLGPSSYMLQLYERILGDDPPQGAL